jgi:hypothetical protein
VHKEYHLHNIVVTNRRSGTKVCFSGSCSANSLVVSDALLEFADSGLDRHWESGSNVKWTNRHEHYGVIWCIREFVKDLRCEDVGMGHETNHMKNAHHLMVLESGRELLARLYLDYSPESRTFLDVLAVPQNINPDAITRPPRDTDYANEAINYWR